MEPELHMPSEEELDVLLKRSDEADDDLMAEYELEQMMNQQLEEEHAEEELAESAHQTGSSERPEVDGEPEPEAERVSGDKIMGPEDLSGAAVRRAAGLKAARSIADESFAFSIFYKVRAMPRATARRLPCTSDRQRQIRSARPGGARRKCVHLQRGIKQLGWYQWCKILTAAAHLFILSGNFTSQGLDQIGISTQER